MGLHALLRLLPMRLQNRMPLDLVVVEEAVRRHRFAPAMACLRHTGRRVGRHSFHQKPRSLVQARVAQVQLLEFRLRPGCRFGNQGVRSKAESKRDPPTVYKRCSISLKVNRLFRDRNSPVKICITKCLKGREVWQISSDKNVMGGGCNNVIPLDSSLPPSATVHPYYLEYIRRHFHDKTGLSWRIGYGS